MKSIFTLFVALATTLSSFAFQNRDPRLAITAVGAPVRVIIDGTQRYQSNGQTNGSLFIDNIMPGNHRIQIFQYRRGTRFNPNGRFEQVYNAVLNFNRAVFTELVVTRTGRVYVDVQRWSQQFDPFWDHSDGWGNSNGWINDDWGNNDNWDPSIWNNPNWNNPNNPNWNNPNWNNPNNPNWNNPNNPNWNNPNNPNWNNSPFGRPMLDADFQQLKQSLTNERFENTRLEIAKTAMTNNMFTTAQVRDLVGLFSFDNNKLELAKHAYRFTVDRNNYFQVGNAFSFSSNREELMRFIQEQR